MTNSPEPTRKTPSRNERKKNRLNIQSVHAPKPVKKTPSRAAKKAAQVGKAPPPPKINRKRRNIISIASIALVVLLIAGAWYYLAAVAPMQRVLLSVGNENVSTGFFLKRAVASNGTVTSTLQLLTVESIIKQNGPNYGATPATEQDIDNYLRNEANSSLLSASNSTTDTTTTTTPTDVTTTTTTTATTPSTTPTMSDTEFNNWFQKQLDNTGLSAKEYREVAGREIQRQRLTAFLSADIPATMFQVHLWAIVYNSNAAAVAAKAKIDGGTDWETMAAAAGQTNKGDLGWWPYNAIDAQLSSSAKTLADTIGICSDPIKYQSSSSTTSSGTTTSYVLLKVSETADSMDVTADQRTILQNNALQNWLNTQASGMTISIHDRNGTTANLATATLDNEPTPWLNYEVQKLLKKRPTETTTESLTTTTSATPAATTTGTSP